MPAARAARGPQHRRGDVDAITRPSGPTVRASDSVVVPKPQPMSSTRSPGRASAIGSAFTVSEPMLRRNGSVSPSLRRPVRSNMRSARYRAMGGSFFLLPFARCQRAQAQGVELDEARRVVLVVGALVVLEGDEVLGVERIGRRAADDQHVALVQLQSHGAGDELLASGRWRPAASRVRARTRSRCRSARRSAASVRLSGAPRRGRASAIPSARCAARGSCRRASRTRRAISCRRSGSRPDRRGRCRCAPPSSFSRQQRGGRQRLAVDGNRVALLESDLDHVALSGASSGDNVR